MIGILHDVREMLGVAHLTEYVDAAPSRPYYQLALEKAYDDAVLRIEAPPVKSADALRPVLLTSAMSDTDEAEVAARSLLLCDSVVVVIPESRLYIPRLFRLLVLLEDAIDAGLVIPLPEPVTYAGLQRKCSAFDAVWTRHCPPEGTSDRADPNTMMADLNIAQAVDLCLSFPTAFDLVTRCAIELELVRDLVTSSCNSKIQLASGRDRLVFVPTLLDLQLPDVRLHAAELVRLRRDGVFQTWRAALSAALQTISSMSEEVFLDPAHAVLALLCTELNAAARSSVAETKRSSVLASALKGVVAFGLGCAAGAIGALGGVDMGAAGGGAAVAAGLSLEWLGGRPKAGERTFRKVTASIFEDTFGGIGGVGARWGITTDGFQVLDPRSGAE